MTTPPALWMIGLSIWAIALTLVFWGTWLTFRHFKRHVFATRPHWQPVSILKPVKGAEASLKENIESFFRLHYPQFEILFSVADVEDPAIPILRQLMAKYPRVRTRLFIGEVVVGPNPKVNNLVKSYHEARHDWILISDSNVCVEPDYLWAATEQMKPDVGVITSVVRGTQAHTPGGYLESIFLNSFYARWMLLAGQIGQPCVLGKSMLFCRSQAARFGGLTAMGRYLAEDYMAGQAMQMLGLKIVVQKQAVQQPLRQYSFRAFWSRHVRWGRIRKAQAPGPFFMELLMSSFVSGILGMLSWIYLNLGAWQTFVALHIILWAGCDIIVNICLGERFRFRMLLAWCVREVLSLPLWLHIVSGTKVKWRGQSLHLQKGGVLREPVEAK